MSQAVSANDFSYAPLGNACLSAGPICLPSFFPSFFASEACEKLKSLFSFLAAVL